MPSGITHILLAKTLPDHLPDNELKAVLQASMYSFQTGSVGPDLPYASIADPDDLFFKTQSGLADKFHYIKTNEIPLLAFKKLKKERESFSKRELRTLFSFFLGYLAHLYADGIMHPFIRDMVGEYFRNKDRHRILEMQLDVILFHHLTNGKINLNYSNIHDELLNFLHVPECETVLEIFSRLINKVYGIDHSAAVISGWIEGLHTMFDIAEGRHPFFYRYLKPVSGYLFKDYDEVKDNEKACCALGKPVDRDTNFIKEGSIHFLDNCVPHFYQTFIPAALKAYNYVYHYGSPLSVFDIPPIDLDTGRLLTDLDLENIPFLWS